MRRTAAGLLVVALLVTLPAVASEEPAPCPEGKIHTWGVLCLTPEELLALEAPAPAPAAPGPTYEAGVEQWRPMVAFYWPWDHVDRMLRIMRCESGGRWWAYNPSGATGLFQIMPFWQRAWPGDYYDPWTNAAVAYQIWLTQGYRAWVCKG